MPWGRTAGAASRWDPGGTRHTSDVRQLDTRPLRHRPPRGSVAQWQREVQRAVRARGAPVTVSTQTSPSPSVSRWRELRIRLWWLPLAVLVAAGIGIIVSEGDWENLLPTLISVAVLGALMLLAVRWLQRRATPEWVQAYQLTAFAETNGLTSLLGVPDVPALGRRRDVVHWQQGGFGVETGTSPRAQDTPGAARRYLLVRLSPQETALFDPRTFERLLAEHSWSVNSLEHHLLLWAPPGAAALHVDHWLQVWALVEALVGPAGRTSETTSEMWGL